MKKEPEPAIKKRTSRRRRKTKRRQSIIFSETDNELRAKNKSKRRGRSPMACRNAGRKETTTRQTTGQTDLALLDQAECFVGRLDLMALVAPEATDELTEIRLEECSVRLGST